MGQMSGQMFRTVEPGAQAWGATAEKSNAESQGHPVGSGANTGTCQSAAPDPFGGHA